MERREGRRNCFPVTQEKDPHKPLGALVTERYGYPPLKGGTNVPQSRRKMRDHLSLAREKPKRYIK